VASEVEVVTPSASDRPRPDGSDIRKITQAAVWPVAQTLAQAFYDDAHFRWIGCDDTKRMLALEQGSSTFIRRVWLLQDEGYTHERLTAQRSGCHRVRGTRACSLSCCCCPRWCATCARTRWLLLDRLHRWPRSLQFARSLQLFLSRRYFHCFRCSQPLLSLPGLESPPSLPGVRFHHWLRSLRFHPWHRHQRLSAPGQAGRGRRESEHHQAKDARRWWCLTY
jgi:hypothetical protein